MKLLLFLRVISCYNQQQMRNSLAFVFTTPRRVNKTFWRATSWRFPKKGENFHSATVRLDTFDLFSKFLRKRLSEKNAKSSSLLTNFYLPPIHASQQHRAKRIAGRVRRRKFKSIRNFGSLLSFGFNAIWSLTRWICWYTLKKNRACYNFNPSFELKETWVIICVVSRVFFHSRRFITASLRASQKFSSPI